MHKSSKIIPMNDLLYITGPDFYINQIKLHAKKAGLSMAEIARISGVDPTTLWSKTRSLVIRPATAHRIFMAIRIHKARMEQADG